MEEWHETAIHTIYDDEWCVLLFKFSLKRKRAACMFSHMHTYECMDVSKAYTYELHKHTLYI